MWHNGLRNIEARDDWRHVAGGLKVHCTALAPFPVWFCLTFTFPRYFIVDFCIARLAPLSR